MQEFCVGRGRGNSSVSIRDLIVTPQGSDQGMVVALCMVFDCVGYGRGNSASLGVRDYWDHVSCAVNYYA